MIYKGGYYAAFFIALFVSFAGKKEAPV